MEWNGSNLGAPEGEHEARRGEDLDSPQRREPPRREDAAPPVRDRGRGGARRGERAARGGRAAAEAAADDARGGELRLALERPGRVDLT